MKIEILCGSGSPVGITPSDIYGKNGRPGIGGAELALFTLCEGWHKAGHEVVLYNDPLRSDAVFEQRKVRDFDKDTNKEIAIFFREPSPKVVRVSGKKIFFSCDQFTAGDFAHFSKFVDKVVTISPFHAKYFKDVYGIVNSIHIDLPVRDWEYGQGVEKVPNRLIFTSVPDRGLDIVLKTYPQIRNAVPDVSIVVTSDYRLWGANGALNDRFVQGFLSQKNVQFLGAVSRERLVQEQLKAQIHYYPFNGKTEELFCIAAAESQIAGVLPITSSAGALETTNMGVLIHGNANDVPVQQAFIQKTIEYLQNPKLPEFQKDLQCRASKRFSLERILNEWRDKVFNDC